MTVRLDAVVNSLDPQKSLSCGDHLGATSTAGTLGLRNHFVDGWQFRHNSKPSKQRKKQKTQLSRYHVLSSQCKAKSRKNKIIFVCKFHAKLFLLFFKNLLDKVLAHYLLVRYTVQLYTTGGLGCCTNVH